MQICGIYKIINLINNKTYIGKSKDIQRRWKEHKIDPFNTNNAMYNSLLYKDIRKYGLNNFEFQIVEECEESQLNEREKYWIASYNTYVQNTNGYGYNMTKGGEYTALLPLFDREKVLQLWNQNKSFKEIQKEVGCSKTTLTNILNDLNISVKERFQRGARDRNVAVLQYDLMGNFIKEYISIADAAQEVQTSTGNIIYACNGKLKSTAGFQWRYKTTDNIIQKIDNYCVDKGRKGLKVIQYDLNGNFIQIFDNAIIAAKNVGITYPSSINRVCSGKRKTAGGYIWKYQKNEQEEVQIL